MAIFLYLVPFLHFLMAGGLVFLLYELSIDPQPLVWLVERHRELLATGWGEYYLVAAAVLVALLELEFVFLKVRGKKKSRYIVFRHAEGRVSLSIRAIEEFIQEICKGFYEIKEIQPKVFQRSRTFKVILELTLWGGSNLSSVSEEIQRTVLSQIQNILGIEKKINVEVVVKEVCEKRKEFTEEKTFRGIVTQ
ncbi:MAG: alkaline shock response membrane anchor protein AmaP [Chlamydiae bacterium]|nr:alkaline shock response membrane anchor protein AmaP [Chlamydiota bacterium]MBI3267158.1 alkaline shock response membrane anchor protein AmaP [Chlamydiota bacterium]